MSRTKKDRPLWVRNNDVTERRVAMHYQGNPFSHNLRCSDICTVETAVSMPRREWKYDHSPCGYIIVLSRNWHNTPSREDRRGLYHGPIRSEELRFSRKVRDGFNNGDDQWEDEEVRERTNKNIKRYWNW